MKITSLLQNNVATFGASGVFLIVFSILGVSVNSKISIHNPFLVLTLFFMVQAIVAMVVLFIDDFETTLSKQSVALTSRILSPIKIITATVICSFTQLRDIPIPVVVFLLFMLVWLLATGITGIVCYYAVPMSQALKLNREAEKITRSEEALLKDLDQYLSKVDI